MVGDRQHDVAGAHAHGTRAVGVTWGYGDDPELDAAGAEAPVRGVAALPAALDSLRAAPARPLAAPLG